MSDNLLGRTIRLINILIAAAIAVAAGAVWWYAWRPLPQTSGAIDAPLAEAATVTRDALGVPHIRAASQDDALFLQGYVTAQDRLFQMDGLRRLSGGTLAEVVGPAALESDRDSRRLRIRRLAEAAYLTLPAADRTALGAYARGVNHFISTHRNNLPLEFSLLNYQPRPWSEVDTLIVGLHLIRTLTTTWRDELVKRNMLSGGAAAKVEFLFPPRAGSEVQPGSNAWAIAGSRTATGRPLLSNDMHLEYTLPGIWYTAHLQAPGLDVSGVTMPGLPGVIAGHNRRIAWGITNLQFDVQDLYIEKIDDRTGRYLFRGQMEQARAEREVVQVKGGQPSEMLIWVTRHGPILVSEGTDRMALRWIAAEPGGVSFPILDIDRAQNWEQFTAALARFGAPGSNFVYADVDGNIGYHAAAKLPVRRKHRGDLPVDGSSGEYEWDGFVPPDQLPSAFNPPDGIVVTANQNPFPENWQYPVNGSFAAPYRSNQIRNLLLARQGWRAADLLAVQRDVYSGFSKFLAGQLVAAYEKRNAQNPSLAEPLALLRAWNGQMDKDLAAPFIVALAYQHLRAVVAENASPGHGRAYEFSMAPSVLERLLRERPGGWFRDYDETLLRTFADAVEEARRMQGREAKKWRYGAYLRWTANNPVVSKLPWIGGHFNIGPVPMSGSGTTVKQTTARMGPSMRMNADLGDWERSLLNIPFGQSGQVFSSHYRDQWKYYYGAQGYPMQYGKVAPKGTLEFRPSAQ
jgi:penicillin G amidase